MFDEAGRVAAHNEADVKAAARNLPQMDVLGTLAGGLGHDLRNIVMPVLLRLDVLSTSATLSERDRSDLASIRKSMSHLQRLAEGLRLLSADATSRRSDVQVTTLASWWDDLQTVALDTLPSNTQLTQTFPDSVPELAIPPGVLAQVVISLLIESRHAMGQTTQPRVTLSASEGHGVVRLVIAHNGASMSDDALRHCFEPYAAAHSRENVIGIGLAASRAMMIRYGGELSAHSRGHSSGGMGHPRARALHPDHGASFELCIPIAAANSVESRRVRLMITNPRALAVARMVVSQAGLEAVAADDTREVRAILCDADTLPQILAERPLGDAAVERTPQLIVLGSSAQRTGDSGVQWITPYDADALARALT